MSAPQTSGSRSAVVWSGTRPRMRTGRSTPGSGSRIASRACTPSPAELRRLRLLRDAVRSLVRGDVRSYVRRRDALLRGARYRLAPDGTIASEHEGWTEFCDLLVPLLVALGGERRRLRACGNRRCGWLFVDRSASGRRRWCDAKACGNRMKVRRYRARH